MSAGDVCAREVLTDEALGGILISAVRSFRTTTTTTTTRIGGAVVVRR
jgi:hypothetical protein